MELKKRMSVLSAAVAMCCMPVLDTGVSSVNAAPLLAGFHEVNPGAGIEAAIAVDPRLLGDYDSATTTWTVAKGDYKLILATNAADDQAVSTVVHLEAAVYDMNGKRLRGQPR
ncbi:hypothetical protein [Massilia pseudoviolaceinigra]|uniref:hypothetical protein n=1 Tax=Massilia pseudoviolaceinigra TaxID=3057165 RepID=UPI002796CE11|nr:hypothetical protein [Massilia sp. CCM 9206]MDQ1919199.1 hypothetical protein [Massilia sp. CCM 9206]